ncbi:MAG: HAD-IIA family hydrolase [Solirubrobacteraceae bacterium]
MSLSPLIAAYDNVILDLDGTVWVGDSTTPRAPEAISALRAAGKGLAFLTNDGSLSPEEYVRKLWSLGCTAGVEEIVSVGSVIGAVLAEITPPARVYVIGGQPIFRQVSDAGHRVINGTDQEEQAEIVVALSHPSFSYRDMLVATRALYAGARLISGGQDRAFPTAGGIAPGTGAVAAALEFAADVKATFLGKPNPRIFEIALDRLRPGRTLMIGDHLASDVDGAHAAGLDAALVLSGVSTQSDLDRWNRSKPISVGPYLAALVLNP